MSPHLAAQLKVVQTPVRDLDGVQVGHVEEDGYGTWMWCCAECFKDGPRGQKTVFEARDALYRHASFRHGART